MIGSFQLNDFFSNTLVFISCFAYLYRRPFFSFESLILAQDERWRRG